MIELLAGTYRLGSFMGVDGQAGYVQYRPEAGHLGRWPGQFLGFYDCEPERDYGSSQKPPKRPREVASGDLTIRLWTPAKQSGQSLSHAFNAQKTGLSLWVAGLDTIGLPGDPVDILNRRPTVRWARYNGATPPVINPSWNPPADTDQLYGNPLAHEPGRGVLHPFTDGMRDDVNDVPPAIAHFTRIGPNVLPALSSSPCVEYDLRRIAGGARFVAVWMRGYWIDPTGTDTRHTAAADGISTQPQSLQGRSTGDGDGWPICWSILDSPPCREVAAHWYDAITVPIDYIDPAAHGTDVEDLTRRHGRYRMTTIGAGRTNRRRHVVVQNGGSVDIIAAVDGHAGPLYALGTDTETIEHHADPTVFAALPGQLDLYAAGSGAAAGPALAHTFPEAASGGGGGGFLIE